MRDITLDEKIALIQRLVTSWPYRLSPRNLAILRAVLADLRGMQRTPSDSIYYEGKRAGAEAGIRAGAEQMRARAAALATSPILPPEYIATGRMIAAAIRALPVE